MIYRVNPSRRVLVTLVARSPCLPRRRQVGVEEVCGKIRVKVRWESETLASTPEDYPRLFLRDVFGPDQKVRR